MWKVVLRDTLVVDATYCRNTYLHAASPSQVSRCCFCCLLFTGSESLGLAHIQRKGTYTLPHMSYIFFLFFFNLAMASSLYY